MAGFGQPPKMRWGLPIVLLLVFVFTSFPAAAQSGQPWQIRELAGDARVEVDGVQPVALTPGDQLAPGQRIVTGSSGRVVLERGDERIVVSPDSVVGLPAQNDGNFATRVLHRLGTILLDVEHKDHQHFEVVTPFMTAVVKGTRFTVSVQQGASAVQVLDGLVEVSDGQGRGRTLVRPGETASADDSGLALNGQDVDPGTGDTADEAADDTTNDGAPTEAADADDTDATTTQTAASDAGAATAAASDDAAASGSGAQVTLPDQASETAAVAIGETLGDDTIDIASLTDGLLDGPAGGPGNSGGAGNANAQGNGLGPTGAPGQSGNLPEAAQGDGPSRVARTGTSGNNGNSANNSNAGNGPPRHSNAGGNSGNNGNPGNGGNPGNNGNNGNGDNPGNNGNGPPDHSNAGGNGNNGNNGNGGNPGNNGNNGNGNNGNNGNGGNNGQGNGNG